MRTSKSIGVVLTMLAFAGATAAQSSAVLKRELKKRESATAKTDADGFVEIARWAKSKGLLKDSKRLLQKALKIDPDHEGANTAMGLVKLDGKWISRAKAEIMKQRAIDASMKEKGFVKVDGVWVEKERVKDAKKGVFWHEGIRVSKTEKRAYLAGKVRHPRTGTFINADDMSKAESGMFPGEDGQWLSEEEANKFHANRDRPWVVRATHVTLCSTLPLDKVEAFKHDADGAAESVAPLFLGKHPQPSHRPVIWIAKDTAEYREFGSEAGGGGSAFGAFDSNTQLDVPGLGRVRPAFCNNLPNWAIYYVKHAAGLAFAMGKFDPAEIEPPAWFLRGVGSLAERFQVRSQTAHFGRQHVQKGGIKNLKTWFSAFAINGGMESRDIEYNVFQAGLVIDYAMKGGHDKSLQALQAISSAVAAGKSKQADKAFDKFKKVLIGQTDGMRSYLEQLTR